MCEKNHRTVYGIDLGSSYSAIAFVNEDGWAEVVSNVEGDRITASAVFVEPDEMAGKRSVVVGKVAKELASTDPDHFIDFVKPHMGDVAWKREIERITWTPEMVSAAIVRKLVQGVEYCGEKVHDVVITCPVGFSSAQRQATITAGKLAGLNVVGLIDDTTAVALSYSKTFPEKSKTVMVYDLGGSAFEVAVVNINKGSIEVVCSGGNSHLGGKDWDDALARYLAGKFAKENNVPESYLWADLETSTELRIGAERTKCFLTRRPEAAQKIFYSGIKSHVKVTKETFEILTKPLLYETVALTEKMLNVAAEKGVTNIDECLLAGGSSRMPQIREMIVARFGSRIGKEPYFYDDGGTVVKGAAIYGYGKNVSRLAQDRVGGGSSETEEFDMVAGVCKDLLTPAKIENAKKIMSNMEIS